MESASLHDQHQLQQHFVGCSSSATQSGYGVSTAHDCYPSSIWGGNNHNMYMNESLPNSWESWPKNSIIVPPAETSKIQDLGFCEANSFTNQSSNELLLAKIKGWMSDSFPKYSDMAYSTSNVEELHLPSKSYIKHEQQECNSHDLGENPWLSNFSSGRQITGLQCTPAGELFLNAQNTACFGGIASVSGRSMSSSLVLSFMGLNLNASDVLTSTNYDGSLGQSPHDNLGLFRLGMSSGYDQMQESSNSSPSNSSNKTSVFMNGITGKRPSPPEPKAPYAAAKKPRLGSQPSCPPLKVRKEKLGDRIAALQRLVSPFGKTDTASVLTEAIGYIQFLQGQIQTLSVPYMKSSSSKPYKAMQVGPNKGDGKEEAKQDLKSRGLCLVPISCTSYITTYDNGGIRTTP